MVRNSHDRRSILRLTGIAVAGAFAGCLGGDDEEEDSTPTPTGEEADEDDNPMDPDIIGPGSADILVGPDGDPGFDPDELSIAVGDDVKFEWDSDGHNINVVSQPDDGDWSGVDDLKDAGFTHTNRFQAEGTYEFVCDEHEDQGATGTIEVNGN